MKNLTLLLSVFTLFSFFSCEKEALVLPGQAQEELNYEIPATKLETGTAIYSKGETATENTFTTAGNQNQESAPIGNTTSGPQGIPIFNAPATPETPPRTTTGIEIYTPTTTGPQGVPVFNEPSSPETPPRSTEGISIYTPDTHQGEVIIFGEGNDNP